MWSVVKIMSYTDDALISSNSVEWTTPPSLFRDLDDEFYFTLDPSATKENALCQQFFTVEDDGLKQKWHGRVYCNPPYGRKSTKEWVKKAWCEINDANCEVVVLLIPSRTDTGWWHDYVSKSKEIRMIRGRLRFNNQSSPAPFPSAVVIFERGHGGPPNFVFKTNTYNSNEDYFL